MKFNYETQGAITYLVCELDSGEQVDSLTLGMLNNNHINGLAPVLYTEMDGHRYLKYNISAKVAVNQFFSGTVCKQRALQAFQSILNALCSADEYMIDQNCFSVKPEHVFLNVSNCEAALICIPVSTDININTETAVLFKQILFTTQFDPNEDAGYITRMITYLNNGTDFSVYGFKDLVQSIISGGSNMQNAAPMNAAPMNNQTNQNLQNPNPTPPVSSFDSTISIDDMPQAYGENPQNNSFVKQPVPMQPAQPQPQIRKPVPVQPTQPQPQIRQPVQQPMGNTAIPTPSVKPQQPLVPPAQNNAAKSNVPFAIPGQSTAGVKTPQNQPPVQAKQPQQPNGEQEQKKMSFFNLMMHYNKENAAIYKAQKETQKGQIQKKSTKQDKQQKKAKMNQVMQQNSAQQPVAPAAGMQGAPLNQQNQHFRTPVQPVPVQSCFNETTVLNPVGGETTVLSEVPTSGEPYLTRVKTGERIIINKPVFRIGKEKSYVDYFIADNTAISRSHCNIHSENGEYYIEDTNSTNHTYVNGNIINSNAKVKLSNGDRVRLANEDFTFSI